MHGAPSVIYPVGRSHWAAALLLLVWCAGSLAGLAWAWQSASPAWARLLVLACCVLSGGWAAVSWLGSAQGELAWTGACWRWSTAGAADDEGRVTPALDLQALLLLRWHGASAGPRWLWLERARAPVHWLALRRAVYSPAKPDAQHGGEPPPAAP